MLTRTGQPDPMSPSVSAADNLVQQLRARYWPAATNCLDRRQRGIEVHQGGAGGAVPLWYHVGYPVNLNSGKQARINFWEVFGASVAAQNISPYAASEYGPDAEGLQ